MDRSNKKQDIFVMLLLAFAMCISAARGQDSRKVPISFLPPPLENATYSLGIYDAKSGKLVRRLHEIAPESAFIVGLNGLMTSWDGKDDAGNTVASGQYAARGYAVSALKVEGTAILGNDWASNDENLRISHIECIALISEDNGLGVLATVADGSTELMRFSGKDFSLIWRQRVGSLPTGMAVELLTVGENLDLFDEWQARNSGVMPKLLAACRLDTGEIIEKHTLEKARPIITTGGGVQVSAPSVQAKHASDSYAGRDGTSWRVSDVAIVQMARDGDVLRKLDVSPGDPLPQVVLAASAEDRIYLLEEKEGWQRVRGLVWVDAKIENGKAVSTWQTFFERSIRTTKPGPVSDSPMAVEMSLVENPLVPGKLQRVKLKSTYDDKGSYLALADGLHVRQISGRKNLNNTKLIKIKATNTLTFFEADSAAWDEFLIKSAQNMMAFDAGEFEMTADGEKSHTEKPTDPPDL